LSYRDLDYRTGILYFGLQQTKPTPEFIDSFISAQIPDPSNDPLGYAMITEHMVHDPCGKYNPKCSCMKNEKCSKNYPKEFHETMTVHENGFVVYKRPKNERFVIKSGIKLDNHWIVPHNIELLKNMMPILIHNGATRLFLSNIFLSK
jgi:hypothetical protein